VKEGEEWQLFFEGLNRHGMSPGGDSNQPMDQVPERVNEREGWRKAPVLNMENPLGLVSGGMNLNISKAQGFQQEPDGLRFEKKNVIDPIEVDPFRTVDPSGKGSEIGG